MTLALQPITFREACAFVARLHRHHKPPQGHLFSIAVNNGESVVGVAIVGRPVARRLQDGWTCEVTRCCTDGTKNACSKLYRACEKAAAALGYGRILTYTLADESGASLRGAGWKVVRVAGGGNWSREDRPRVDTHPIGQKLLWEPAGQRK